MTRIKSIVLAGLLLGIVSVDPSLAARKKGEEDVEGEAGLSSGDLAGFALRGIGPALTSGRITDIAVQPDNHSVYYATAASGGVWKTVNSGTTWEPIFDGEGSYSIGCITIDPADPLVLWVGSGENNSQRSVSYGDGVYKSTDGGTTWRNMGLESSEHIGKILIDPRDSDTVCVAAQGPLWNAGGDRGLYKSIDGGETWELSLEISENTGVTDVVMDPRNPDVLIAAAYQRRRRTWTLINGGPESALYKTTDGGASWRKLENGLPKEQMGRIGLAISPVDPDVVYAIVEALEDAGGFYRSIDAGANWTKMSDYASGSPQYYQEIIPDPQNVDRVYSMDTWMQVTEDGGKTFKAVPETAKHVDNHALWINPGDTDHLRAGCDGGVYESYDRGQTWRYMANMSLGQFYKVAVDNDAPFYNVYGGTQDNNTLGGPSRTVSNHGITNRDWYVTVGGDGFKPAIDPENPDIVYSQWQYGNLVRFDRRSGETIDIQPQPDIGEDALRWNWDSALMISPHSPSRLYFAAQRVFRSDDRGDSWTPVSDDLTRQIDRNTLEVMGKVWSVDTVAKNNSTSPYGNIVSLTESPLREGLLYAGTDDGLVQVTEDSGGSWRRIDAFPGVPDMSYVSDLEASLHDADTVYATFDNHKSGDFKPYVLKSTDRGATWSSIAGSLPERGTVYAIAQDHENPELLFAGTEFGAFVSVDEGGRWVQLNAGIPVIAVRDIEMQRREDDVVLATFGRGFYILDDYSPLRSLSADGPGETALLFAPRRAFLFNESMELGYPGKGFQGDTFFHSPNPPYGAVATYYLPEAIRSLREQRLETEKEREEAGETLSYPSWDELRAEDREEDPRVHLTVRDSSGNLVRQISGPTGEGFHRVAWDLRYPASTPSSLTPPGFIPFGSPPMGPAVAPGTYTMTLSKRANGETTELAGPVEFEVAPLGLGILEADDRQAVLAFQQETARLQRAVLGAIRAAGEVQARIDHLRVAARDTPDAESAWLDRLDELETGLDDLLIELRGDRTVSSRSEPTPPSIQGRVMQAIYGQWTSSSAPTATHRRNVEIAAGSFGGVLEGLKTLYGELEALELEMEAAGAPWTPGRLPEWQGE
jgi:photosystem II stability/assembly factor-like uncharacterized protein